MRLLLFIFLFLNLNTFGQVKLLNLDLTVPDTNIIYNRVYQTLKVDYHEEVNLSSNEYELVFKKLGNNKFKTFVINRFIGPFKIYLTNTKGDTIARRNFKAIDLPKPNLVLKNNKENSIKNLIQSDSILISFPKEVIYIGENLFISNLTFQTLSNTSPRYILKHFNYSSNKNLVKTLKDSIIDKNLGALKIFDFSIYQEDYFVYYLDHDTLTFARNKLKKLKRQKNDFIIKNLDLTKQDSGLFYIRTNGIDDVDNEFTFNTNYKDSCYLYGSEGVLIYKADSTYTVKILNKDLNFFSIFVLDKNKLPLYQKSYIVKRNKDITLNILEQKNVDSIYIKVPENEFCKSWITNPKFISYNLRIGKYKTHYICGTRPSDSLINAFKNFDDSQNILIENALVKYKSGKKYLPTFYLHKASNVKSKSLIIQEPPIISFDTPKDSIFCKVYKIEDGKKKIYQKFMYNEKGQMIYEVLYLFGYSSRFRSNKYYINNLLVREKNVLEWKDTVVIDYKHKNNEIIAESYYRKVYPNNWIKESDKINQYKFNSSQLKTYSEINNEKTYYYYDTLNRLDSTLTFRFDKLQEKTTYNYNNLKTTINNINYDLDYKSKEEIIRDKQGRIIEKVYYNNGELSSKETTTYLPNGLISEIDIFDPDYESYKLVYEYYKE